ncbi:type II toxin-antitoxin system RelE family toxin [Archangium sp.]|uniref:type II toxin-antitoxin system RelE family toxin n=1 Tax=Archangium sp. TaxID=1872627 RepID=UPI00389ABCCF
MLKEVGESPRNFVQRIVYTVEISPSAWNQLAHLTLETYRRIRDELDAVAAALGEGSERVLPPRGKRDGGHAPPRLSVVVDDAIALYDVDRERRVVLLLEVARRLPQEL